MADGSGAGSPQAGGPQSEIIRLMSQMRDAIAVSAQCAQSSTSALEALRAERATETTLRGPDLAKVLSKPERFQASSRDEELSQWRNWIWNVEQWLCALDNKFGEEFAYIRGNRNTVVKMSELAVDTRGRSQQLFAVLAGLLHERGRSILRAIGEQNGYEAFRQLEADLAPSSKARHLAILGAIASYPAFSNKSSLLQQVLKLEELFEEYRRVAGKDLDSDVKLSTMLRATGGQLRSFLNSTLTESSTYEELRSVIARWDASQTKWQNPLSAAFGPDSNKNGVADMEIDRVGEHKGGKKGKGKGKGKDNKGKGKGGKSSFHDYNQQNKGGKSKGKGKGKDGKGHEGKGKSGGNNNKCLRCGKPGHWRRDCWQLQRDQQQGIRRAEQQNDVEQNQQPAQPTQHSNSSELSSTRQSFVPSLSSATTYRNVRQVSNVVQHHLDDGLEQYDLTIFSMEETDDEANIHMVEQFFLHDGSDYEDAHEDHSLVHLYETAFEQLAACSKSNGIDMDNTHVCMDGNYNSLISDLHVRMINGRAYSDEFEEDVQLILDSGADISVLPERYGSVGEAAAVPSSVRFRDAQGNNLAVQSVRNILVRIGSCSFRETFIIARVTSPLLALGKLLRSGWTISQSDGGPCLQYEDSKRNSLVTDARICMITEQVETPMDAENIESKDMNRVELTSVLERIGESWDQIDVHCFAKKSVGRRYISIAADSPEEGLCYRTTLVKFGEDWEVMQFEFDLHSAAHEEHDARIPGVTDPCEVLTIVYGSRMRPEKLGFIYTADSFGHEDGVSRDFFGNPEGSLEEDIPSPAD